MSLIQITHDLDLIQDEDCCAFCLKIQLLAFRNKIKEQWNRYSNDGLTSRVTIHFTLDPKYLWDPPVTMVGGTAICITHYMIELNNSVNVQAVQDKPQLSVVSGGAIEAFLKKK
jgi:hypothetical protein